MITVFDLYLQLKNANKAANSTAVTKALLDINPIIADKNERHANDKPNGISTWATRTKPVKKKKGEFAMKDNWFLKNFTRRIIIP
jgi:hypothetical protein